MALQAVIKQEEAKRAENLNWLKQKEIDKVKTEQEEKRKTIELELEVQKKRADYINELKRKGYQDRLQDQEKAQDKINKLNVLRITFQNKKTNRMNIFLTVFNYIFNRRNQLKSRRK